MYWAACTGTFQLTADSMGVYEQPEARFVDSRFKAAVRFCKKFRDVVHEIDPDIAKDFPDGR